MKRVVGCYLLFVLGCCCVGAVPVVVEGNLGPVPEPADGDGMAGAQSLQVPDVKMDRGHCFGPSSSRG